MSEYKVELTEEQRQELEKKEKEFRNATPAEKRVLIAKDVLERAGKKIMPAHNWGRFPRMIQYDTMREIRAEKDREEKGLQEYHEEVKEFFNTEVRDVIGPDPECTACALGSLFVCTIIRADDIKVRDLRESLDSFGLQDITEYFEKLDLFSSAQMNLIETAYEKGDGYYKIYPEIIHRTSLKRVRAFRFGQKYSSDLERLTAIMKNIVENDGEFVPPPSPYAEEEEFNPRY